MSDFFSRLSDIQKSVASQQEGEVVDNDNNIVNSDDDNKPIVDNDKPVVEEVVKKEEVQETPEYDTGFFTIKAPVVESKNTEVGASENPEAFFDRVAKEYGFNIKSWDEALGLVGKLKEVEQEHEQSSTKIKDYENLVASIPEDIKAILADAFEGKDYRNTARQMYSNTIDYSKPSDYYSKDDLIKMYNTDISEDEWEDMDDKTRDRLYNVSVRQYNLDRQTVLDRAKDFETRQKESAKLLLTSIDSSIDKLKQTYPSIKREYVNNIRNMMKTNYLANLLNEQNVWKEDAAIKIAMAEYGQMIIDDMTKQLQAEMEKNVRLAASAAREEIVKEKLNDAPTKETHGTADSTTLKDQIKSSMPYLKHLK